MDSTNASAEQNGLVAKLTRILILIGITLPVGILCWVIGTPLGLEAISEVGTAVFQNLPLIFSMAIAIALSDDEHGSAALTGVIGYYILTMCFNAVIVDKNPDFSGVNYVYLLIAGLLSGVMSGLLYNKARHVELPEYLGFFAGRRLSPIVISFAMFFLAYIFSLIYVAMYM